MLNKKLLYEAEVSSLQLEIATLHNKLKTISDKYECAQKQIAEHISSMDELLKICSHNSERFESLTKNYACECQAFTSSHPREMSEIFSQSQADAAQASFTEIKKSQPIPTQKQSNIKIYSDNLGKNMGVILNNICKGHSVLNCCMPGATYSQIMSKILSNTHCPNTILIILIGGRGNVNKKLLQDYYLQLTNLNVKKIIMFTFPYIKKSPQENDIRYNLNNMLHTLINSNYVTLNDNNSKINLIDINNVINIKNNNLTCDRLHLSYFYKRQIASMLSYYLQFNLANTVAIKNTVPLERYTLTCLESVPNNLN